MDPLPVLLWTLAAIAINVAAGRWGRWYRAHRDAAVAVVAPRSGQVPGW